MATQRGRGRPLSFNREEVLDLVIPMFWERGYDAPSLDELAAVAGLNRTNLRAAFGSKKGLFRASLRRFRDGFAKDAIKALEGPNKLDSALRDFFEHAISVYAREGAASCGCFLFAVAPAAAVADIEIGADVADALDLIREAFATRLAQASLAELSQQGRPSAMADVLVGTLLSLALYARSGAKVQRLREIYISGISMVLRQD